MTSIKGFPIEGRREDLQSQDIDLKPLHTTVTPAGQNRRALDVNNVGFFEVTNGAIVEAGSTDSLIVITGHTAVKGDLIRITSSANGISELEMFVNEIVDANSFKLAGVVSADFAAGDTIDIYRAISPKFEPDGSMSATLTPSPIRINVDTGGGPTSTEVLDDQATPANTVPIPVRLYGTSSNINITADELNVQLSHTGGTPDSIQVGNGTNLMAVNASLEAQVRDDDANTTLTSIDGKDFATETTLASIDGKDFATETTLAAHTAKFGTLGQKTMAGSAPVVIASDQSALDVNDISGTVSLPTGASTSALQTTGNTSLASIDSKQTDIRNSLDTLDNTVNGSNQVEVRLADLNGAATEATLSSIDGKDFSTETTLSAMSAKLPAALGPQADAGSLSVTYSNDGSGIPVDTDNVVAFQRLDFSSNNVTAGGYTELIGDIGATAGKKVQIFMSTGEPMYLATGGAGSENNRMIIFPGGFNGNKVELSLAANVRLSLQKVTAGTVSAGQIIINVEG